MSATIPHRFRHAVRAILHVRPRLPRFRLVSGTFNSRMGLAPSPFSPSPFPAAASDSLARKSITYHYPAISFPSDASPNQAAARRLGSPKTHAMRKAPRAAAVRIRRGRQPPRTIAGFTAAQAKLHAALRAPAAGGRRPPPCALGGGGAAHRQLLCPPLPPAFALPPPSPAAPAHPCGHAAGHSTIDGRNARGPPGRQQWRFPPPIKPSLSTRVVGEPRARRTAGAGGR